MVHHHSIVGPIVDTHRKSTKTIIVRISFLSTIFLFNIKAILMTHWFIENINMDSCFYAFSYESSQCLHERMQSHTGCICETFLHCVFSSESSNWPRSVMYNYIGCICVTFLRCVFSNASSNCLPELMHSYIGCICLTLQHCQLFFSWFLFLNQSYNFWFVPLIGCCGLPKWLLQTEYLYNVLFTGLQQSQM